MSDAVSYPGVYAEADSSHRAISGAPTSIGAFVGRTVLGERDQPGHVSSFAQFEADFGGLGVDMPFWYAVDQFFQNGGTEAYVVRVASDGAMPVSSALVGDPVARTGLYALDDVDLFNLLVIAEAASEALALRSPNSAFFFPRIRATDRVSGAVRECPVAGAAAGIYARTDALCGVWRAPADIAASVEGTLGLTLDVDDQENGALNDLGLNCLRTFPNIGTVFWGARGASDPADDYQYVPVRRLALFMEESLKGRHRFRPRPRSERLRAVAAGRVLAPPDVAADGLV